LEEGVKSKYLFNAIWYADQENQHRIASDGQRKVLRIDKFNLEQEKTLSDQGKIVPNFSYLITGGLEGLGLKVAEYFVEQGATHLVLTDDRGVVNDSQQEAIEALEAQGAKIRVVKVDVAIENDVKVLFEKTIDLAPLKGIVHAVGTINGATLINQNEEVLAKAFASKVKGTWHLHQNSQNLPLDFFVSFSSQTSLIGHAGQINSAVAHTFMDNLMLQRQQQGLPALSINWEGGLANHQIEEAKKAGMTPEEVMTILDALLAQPVAQVGVSTTKWKTLVNQYQAVGATAMLQKLMVDDKAATPKTKLGHQLKKLNVEDARALLKKHIQTEIQFILGKSLSDDARFFVNGLDSLMAVQLTQRLSKVLSISLPTTVTLEYTTIELLTSHLIDFIAGENVDEEVAETTIQTVQTMKMYQ